MSRDPQPIRIHAAKHRFKRRAVRFLVLMGVVLAMTWAINVLGNRRPDEARTFVWQKTAEDMQERAAKIGR